jgi:arylsulfatase A-like enzyme
MTSAMAALVYGNKIVKTPPLDRFTRKGMRFTDCYSADPNCSPSRTGLMTDRIPTRLGVHNWIPMFSPMHVPAALFSYFNVRFSV